MYNIFTKLKTPLATAAFSIALATSGAAMAGPGKPGTGNDPDTLDGLNIIDIALAVNDGGSGEFNNLLAAVECFGDLSRVPGDNPIIDLLDGTDKYTLLAPVDAAFDDLLCRLGISDPCNVDSVTFDGALQTVLEYHVVDGRRFSNSLFNKNNSKIVETLAGVDIVSYIDTDPTLHDVDGQMINPVEGLFNINATNGVIHVVDGVLLPVEVNPKTCEE